MGHDGIPDLDPLIHAPNRLAVMSLLSGVESAEFTFIRDAAGITDGNLSTHLKKLEEAGYVKISKSYRGRRPLTTVGMTGKGKKAFDDYLDTLEEIVRNRSKKGRR